MIGLFRYSKKGLLIRAETRKLEAGDERYLKGHIALLEPCCILVINLCIAGSSFFLEVEASLTDMFGQYDVLHLHAFNLFL